MIFWKRNDCIDAFHVDGGESVLKSPTVLFIGLLLITEGTLVTYYPQVRAMHLQDLCLHLSHLACFFTACFPIEQMPQNSSFTETFEVRNSGLCCATVHCETAVECPSPLFSPSRFLLQHQPRSM